MLFLPISDVVVAPTSCDVFRTSPLLRPIWKSLF